MPIRNNYSNKMGLGGDNISQVRGLTAFHKSLEKYFFSEAYIACSPTSATEANLIVEIRCNFSLSEAISVLAKANNSNFLETPRVAHIPSCFTTAFLELLDNNKNAVDVEEFTIFLKDITIVVNKIYPQSIPDQLDMILRNIATHYVYYTKGLTEIPYEIYVPVFEEGQLENDSLAPLNIGTAGNPHKDYFGFWGLYHDSDEDAVVYDLKSKTMIRGELLLLNQ